MLLGALNSILIHTALDGVCKVRNEKPARVLIEHKIPRNKEQEKSQIHRFDVN